MADPPAARTIAADQFQQISYHDTPEQPLRELRYRDDSVPSEGEFIDEIATINGTGLLSSKSPAAKIRNR